MSREQSGHAVLVFGSDGNLKEWNNRLETISGYTAPELQGRQFGMFFRGAGDSPDLFRQVFEDGQVSLQCSYIRKGGQQVPASVFITAIRGVPPRADAFVCVIQGAVAVAAKDEQSRLYEERHEQMTAEVQDYAIILLDKEGNIQNWNLGAEKIKGYKAAEITGRHFSTFYLPEDQERGLPGQLLNEAAVHGRAYHEGYRVRKDQTRFWGSIVITALHNTRGEVIGFSKVTKDLTEKKLAEDTQQKYLRQLEIRSKDMEQLAYIASHDLQEPLRTILSFLDLFKEKFHPVIDEEGNEYIAIISRSGNRMRELIKAILDYSIIGTSKQPTEVDCNVLMEEIKNDLAAIISETGAVIEISNLPVLHGLRVELRQLFQNMLSNALKFCRPGIPPVVSISAEKQQGKWLFAVSDNGIGMDKRYVHKIFMMFQRLNNKGDFAGNGIGLAYAKKIVELHNGSIWVDSELSKGSTFYFEIENI